MEKGARILFAVLCILFTLAGCNIDWNGSDSSVDQTKKETNEIPKYGKIIVDNLRMRDASGLGAQEITQIGINQLVRLTGNLSDTTETISIRGSSTPQYWHEIVFNGDTGWVYGGGMEVLNSLETVNSGELNDYRIESGIRAGLVSKDATHQSLEKILGPDEVIKENLPIGEGRTVKGSVIYPNTNNEMRIYWQDEDFIHLRQIIISKPGGKWQTANGITIGQPIEEVTDKNGTPFEMTGFEWDFSGTTLNWQGGKLPSSLTLSFDHHGDISIYPFLIGDKVISSDNSSLLKLKPKVRQILISFNE